jgi:hypothetical protein
MRKYDTHPQACMAVAVVESSRLFVNGENITFKVLYRHTTEKRKALRRRCSSSGCAQVRSSDPSGHIGIPYKCILYRTAEDERLLSLQGEGR